MIEIIYIIGASGAPYIIMVMPAGGGAGLPPVGIIGPTGIFIATGIPAYPPWWIF